jgi:hypothetical protein
VENAIGHFREKRKAFVKYKVKFTKYNQGFKGLKGLHYTLNPKH